MLITLPSQMTGVVHTKEINMTQDQYDNWLYGTDLIQDALPHLTDSEREFLMTGIIDEEWDSLVPYDDYDGDDGWDHEDDDPSEDDMLYEEDRMSLRDKQINDRLDMGKNEAGEWLGWTT
jgi:hypothetical protein